MKESAPNWEKSSYINARKVIQSSNTRRAPARRLSRVLPAGKVRIASKPVIIGKQEDQIRIEPIMQNGRIRSLRVICACGRESTFDIQYSATEGTAQ